MGNLYTFALYGVVVLAVVVFVLAFYAVLTRWLSERRQTRASKLRPRMREAVEGFLDGRVVAADAERELAADRKLGLGVLLGVASARSRDDQVRLRPLAERFGYERQQLQALTHGNPGRRANAAVHLGYLGSDAAGPALLAALHDEHLDVRLAAAQALVQMRRSVTVVPILRALALPGRWPLQRATELLYGFGATAIAPLRHLLAQRTDAARADAERTSAENTNTERTDAARTDAESSSADATVMPIVAINVLGLLGARDAAGQVASWLDHSECEVRVAAAKALGNMRQPMVVDALLHALRDSDWQVRSMAAKSLGRLGEPRVIPALDGALGDPAWWVRYNAAHALAELGGDGLDALQRALSTQSDPFARDISRQTLEERNLLLEATS